jgi:polynucleotide 5'-hydroxyl-kinase GRC3/NOL9
VVPFGAVSISFSHADDIGSDELLRALNGSVVALIDETAASAAVSLTTTTATTSGVDSGDGDEGSSGVGAGLQPALRLTKMAPTAACLGLAVVRAVDPVRQVLYVLTPVLPDVLQRCTTLCRGALELPSEMLLHGAGAGSLPYITLSFSSTSVKGAKNRSTRSNLNRKKFAGGGK